MNLFNEILHFKRLSKSVLLFFSRKMPLFMSTNCCRHSKIIIGKERTNQILAKIYIYCWKLAVLVSLRFNPALSYFYVSS